MESLKRRTDDVNRAGHTRQKIQQRWPDETILLTTAATVLKSQKKEPVGWSLARISQLRCVAVFTTHRVLVETSTRSLMQLFWLLLGLGSVYAFFTQGNPMCFAIVPGVIVLLLQRRPFAREWPYAELSDVAFGEVRGASGRADIASLTVGSDTWHVALNRPLPDDLRTLLEQRNAVR